MRPVDFERGFVDKFYDEGMGEVARARGEIRSYREIEDARNFFFERPQLYYCGFDGGGGATVIDNGIR